MAARHRKKVIESSKSTDDEDEGSANEEIVAPPAPKEPITLKKVLVRTSTAILMIGFYLAILQAGHFYCILLGVITQTEVYRELVNVRYVEAKSKRIPWFRTLQWAWFFVPMFFVYGETLYRFSSEQPHLYQLSQYLRHYHHISFAMYCALFVLSVTTLKKGLVRFQLSQLLWSIVTVCFVVFQCKFFARHTLKGLFWFFFPMATVVMNDVSAYFCGITMGRKIFKSPFFAMSPNKTWEGFIGAGILTMVFSFYWPLFLSQWTWFTCPAVEIAVWPFPAALVCNLHPVFVRTVVNLPVFGPVSLLPIQLHGLAYGLFASLVAPFGGLFASAIKRAYGIKDFDSLFPGHGGMMDRMDCQLVMLAFTAFHYYTFIESKAPSVGKMLYLVSLMAPADQSALLQQMSKVAGGGV